MSFCQAKGKKKLHFCCLHVVVGASSVIYLLRVSSNHHATHQRDQRETIYDRGQANWLNLLFYAHHLPPPPSWLGQIIPWRAEPKCKGSWKLSRDFLRTDVILVSLIDSGWQLTEGEARVSGGGRRVKGRRQSKELRFLPMPMFT